LKQINEEDELMAMSRQIELVEKPMVMFPLMLMAMRWIPGRIVTRRPLEQLLLMVVPHLMVLVQSIATGAQRKSFGYVFFPPVYSRMLRVDLHFVMLVCCKGSRPQSDCLGQMFVPLVLVLLVVIAVVVMTVVTHLDDLP
jgi:hypothetical protein